MRGPFVSAFLLLVAFPCRTCAFTSIQYRPPNHNRIDPAKLRTFFPENASRSRMANPYPSSVSAPSTITRRKNNSRLLYANIVGEILARPQQLVGSLFQFRNVPLWQAFGINAILFSSLQQKLQKMLTPSGSFNAFLLGVGLWRTLGWRGWTLCVVYLFLGQLVTKVRFEDKEKRGIAEGRGGRRGPENVWGSAFTGLICAICSAQGDTFLGIRSDLYVLGYVASISTKLADTFASEIGKAYGKTTFLITTLKRVEPGTEGAISAEGTAAAVLGGLLLSLYGWLIVGLIKSPTAVLISTIAAFFATNVESVLGATLQGKEGLQWMTNEVVNFLNTLIGGAVAIYAGSLFL